MESETIEFETADGITLVGDLIAPVEAPAAAIVCHPHPLYGGNRFNPVVEALFTHLADAGVAALRFDFRAAFDDGSGERLDAEAALTEMRRWAPDVPIFAFGYSFGAMVTLSLTDDGLAGKVLVAPPLGHMTSDAPSDMAMLVLTPAHDQFAPPDMAEPIVTTWPSGDFEVVPSCDHFIAGRAAYVAERAVEWVDARL